MLPVVKQSLALHLPDQMDVGPSEAADLDFNESNEVSCLSPTTGDNTNLKSFQDHQYEIIDTLVRQF